MLNYIKSEFFRMAHNRNLHIAVGACGALMIVLVVVLKLFSKDPAFSYANTKFALSNIYMNMGTLLIVTVVMSAFMHGDEDKQHTIKHSVSFGIKRSTIYIGRFCVQMAVSCLIYVVLVSLFTVASYLLLPHSNLGELESLIRVSIGGCTCLIAALSVTHYFSMSVESQHAATVGPLAIVVLVAVPYILNTLGRKVEVFRIVGGFFPASAIDTGSSLVSGGADVMQGVVSALLIGAVWTIVFCILGIRKFNRLEVK